MEERMFVAIPIYPFFRRSGRICRSCCLLSFLEEKVDVGKKKVNKRGKEIHTYIENWCAIFKK